jgi:hypothetical protein
MATRNISATTTVAASGKHAWKGNWVDLTTVRENNKKPYKVINKKLASLL